MKSKDLQIYNKCMVVLNKKPKITPYDRKDILSDNTFRKIKDMDGYSRKRTLRKMKEAIDQENQVKMTLEKRDYLRVKESIENLKERIKGRSFDEGSASSVRRDSLVVIRETNHPKTQKNQAPIISQFRIDLNHKPLYQNKKAKIQRNRRSQIGYSKIQIGNENCKKNEKSGRNKNKLRSLLRPSTKENGRQVKQGTQKLIPKFNKIQISDLKKSIPKKSKTSNNFYRLRHHHSSSANNISLAEIQHKINSNFSQTSNLSDFSLGSISAFSIQDNKKYLESENSLTHESQIQPSILKKIYNKDKKRFDTTPLKRAHYQKKIKQLRQVQQQAEAYSQSYKSMSQKKSFDSLKIDKKIQEFQKKYESLTQMGDTEEARRVKDIDKGPSVWEKVKKMRNHSLNITASSLNYGQHVDKKLQKKIRKISHNFGALKKVQDSLIRKSSNVSEHIYLETRFNNIILEVEKSCESMIPLELKMIDQYNGQKKIKMRRQRNKGRKQPKTVSANHWLNLMNQQQPTKQKYDARIQSYAGASRKRQRRRRGFMQGDQKKGDSWELQKQKVFGGSLGFEIEGGFGKGVNLSQDSMAI